MKNVSQNSSVQAAAKGLKTGLGSKKPKKTKKGKGNKDTEPTEPAKK